uniref:Uncharacterized protein n=1 Tax=Arundo donax TaxID=35708 RepID=A0A0A9DZW7_ARUDO
MSSNYDFVRLRLDHSLHLLHQQTSLSCNLLQVSARVLSVLQQPIRSIGYCLSVLGDAQFLSQQQNFLDLYLHYAAEAYYMCHEPSDQLPIQLHQMIVSHWLDLAVLLNQKPQFLSPSHLQL